MTDKGHTYTARREPDVFLLIIVLTITDYSNCTVRGVTHSFLLGPERQWLLHGLLLLCALGLTVLTQLLCVQAALCAACHICIPDQDGYGSLIEVLTIVWLDPRTTAPARLAVGTGCSQLRDAQTTATAVHSCSCHCKHNKWPGRTTYMPGRRQNRRSGEL
jgi:hypothetical protein